MGARNAVLGHLEAQLLRVCFLPAPLAADHWDRSLAATLDLDALPVELHGLLPLLHERLVALDRRHPAMGRLQGVRRRLWVQNELRIRATRPALDALTAAEIPTALLGGVAVLAAHLGRTDLRPLHDVDVVVAPQHADAGIAALRRHGWATGPAWRGGHLLDLRGVRATDPSGSAVSLRWSTSPPYADAVDRARLVPFGDATAAVVAPDDLLLHTLVDGPAARWASDALVVLLGDTPVDWDRMATTTAARHAALVVAHRMDALAQLGPLPLPDRARSLADGAPRLRWGWPRAGMGRPTAIRAYARRMDGAGPVRIVRSLPAYLCEVWDLDGARDLPTELARRAGRRVRGKR